MQKIGLFGGTFNPIHNGHLHLADAFCRALMLDELFFIPTYSPPHKDAQGLASGADRYNMCRVAISGLPGARVSDFEIRRETKSYTVYTLQHFKERYPDAEFYFLMGFDMFITLEQWHEANALFRFATMCAGARSKGEYEQLVRHAAYLAQKGAKTHILDVEPYEASSTRIRTQLAQDIVPAALPQPVLRYIDTVRPYGKEQKEALSYKAEISKRLSPVRYEHSLCVAKEAVTLSILFGADEKRAYAAGLLHDIAKDLPQAEQLQMLKKSGIILDDVERVAPKLWHAIIGTQLVRDIGINDTQIINAIRYHTTAREGITLLEQVIYLADCISFDRRYTGADAIRERIALGLDSAMLCALSLSIMGLAKKESSIHIDTVKAYNSFLPAQQ